MIISCFLVFLPLFELQFLYLMSCLSLGLVVSSSSNLSLVITLVCIIILWTEWVLETNRVMPPSPEVVQGLSARTGTRGKRSGFISGMFTYSKCHFSVPVEPKEPGEPACDVVASAGPGVWNDGNPWLGSLGNHLGTHWHLLDSWNRIVGDCLPTLMLPEKWDYCCGMWQCSALAESCRETQQCCRLS